MTTSSDHLAPTLTDLPAAMQRTMTPAAQVGTELLQLIKDAIINHPRSLQVAIGPSEYGHDCGRRIGYKLAGVPERDTGRVNWKATVGTAGHAWAETVLDNDNLAYAQRTGTGLERWLVETRVNVGDINGQPLTGSSDAFDLVTGTVIDWKFVGPSMLKSYKKKGPGHGYRNQIHGYGRGFQRLGLTVRHVMIVFLPRDGELDDAYIWTEPYNERVVLEALSRATGIATAVDALGVAALAMLPTADAYCTHCPFFRAGSTDPATGCPGHTGGDHNRSRDQVLDLI